MKWSEVASCVRLFVTPWTVAYQAAPSMVSSRHEYWSGSPFPSPGDLSDPGIEPGSPALQADALPSEPPGKLSKKWVTLMDFNNKVYLTQHVPNSITSTYALTLCNHVDCSSPGSSVHGVFQAWILEWVAISSFLTHDSNPGPLYCRWILYH